MSDDKEVPQLRTLKTFGETLHDIRLKEDISAEVMAERVGVHKSTINNWEAGRMRPSGECTARLLELWPAELSPYLVDVLETKKPGGAPTNPKRGKYPAHHASPVFPRLPAEKESAIPVHVFHDVVQKWLFFLTCLSDDQLERARNAFEALDHAGLSTGTVVSLLENASRRRKD